VAGSDALHAKIARGVAGELKHLGAKVFADSSHVHGRGGANAAMTGDSVLQMPVDAANWKLNQHRVRSHGLPSTLSKHNSQLASIHLVVMACRYLNTIVFRIRGYRGGGLVERNATVEQLKKGEDGNLLSCVAKRRC
jgi:hypothetical protein